MKRYLVLLLTAISLISCNNDSDDYHFEYVPVVTADVPEEFLYGRVYTLNVTYEVPNNCYSIYHYDYLYEGTERIIKPIAIVNDDQTCNDEPYQGTFSIRVTIAQEEPYIFNFWQGEDGDGNPIYLTIEVPVII